MKKIGLLAITLLSASLAMAQEKAVRDVPEPRAGEEQRRPFGAESRFSAMSLEEMMEWEPTSPNPYLSFLPQGVEPDYEYWEAFMMKSLERKMLTGGISSVSADVAITTNEQEINGSPVSANEIARAAIQFPNVAQILGNAAQNDQDFFKVPLVAGDVLSVAVDILPVDEALTFNQIFISLRDPDGVTLVETFFALSLLSALPDNSPLLVDGDSSAAIVIPKTGNYFISLEFANEFDYQMRVTAVRPLFEQAESLEPIEEM